MKRVLRFIGKLIECNRLHKAGYGLIGRQCFHWRHNGE
jgi:hypothetical protein